MSILTGGVNASGVGLYEDIGGAFFMQAEGVASPVLAGLGGSYGAFHGTMPLTQAYNVPGPEHGVNFVEAIEGGPIVQAISRATGLGPLIVLIALAAILGAIVYHYVKR